jgi:DNA primase
MRLADADKARVRAEHPLVEVLRRAGIDPPSGWDGHRDYMVCCPMPDHDDSTPSMIVHPATDRYHCFGCEAHGDVLQLVMSMEGITSLAKGAEVLDRGRPLTVQAPAGGSFDVASVERPDRARTPPERVLAANGVSWRYLTLPRLAGRGRQYLAGRRIDVSALEVETGRPALGHTPWSETGLIDHLRRRGFSDDELVDAGWASRRADSTVVDRYRRRVMIPVRDNRDRVIGVYGRDVTGRANAKYLNTPDTAVYSKGRALYRPSTPMLDPHATVIVCEGSLDALAIAAEAASAGLSSLYAPVTPSGTALTAAQARAVLDISGRPPLVCADGDAAGLAAGARWAELLVSMGRETVATVLPAGLDPADWLAKHGTSGLAAFTHPACLNPSSGPVRPSSAGALIARTVCAEAAKPGVDPGAMRDAVIDRLSRLGAHLPTAERQARFATSAAPVLAQHDLGPDGWLARKIAAAITGLAASRVEGREGGQILVEIRAGAR